MPQGKWISLSAPAVAQTTVYSINCALNCSLTKVKVNRSCRKGHHKSRTTITTGNLLLISVAF